MARRSRVPERTELAMTRVLIVNGSLRARSHTRRMLEFIRDRIVELGGKARLLDLAETPLPMLDPDEEGAVENLDAVTESVLWAEAYLLGSPDYHGSMSGPIVNFLDYFWREFTGKLFGYVVASHEKGLTVQDQMRTAVRQCYGWSLPYGIGFNGDADFDADGKFANERMAARARGCARDLIVYGRLIHGQFQTDLARSPRDPGYAEKFKL
jgi:FMN reductase